MYILGVKAMLNVSIFKSYHTTKREVCYDLQSACKTWELKGQNFCMTIFFLFLILLDRLYSLLFSTELIE